MRIEKIISRRVLSQYHTKFRQLEGRVANQILGVKLLRNNFFTCHEVSEFL